MHQQTFHRVTLQSISREQAMEASTSLALHLLYSCQLGLIAANDVETNPGPSPGIPQGTAMVRKVAETCKLALEKYLESILTRGIIQTSSIQI